MNTYPGTVTGKFIRQVGAPHNQTIIDGYLTPEETDAVYTAWQSNWPEPLAFSGGVKAITLEMVLEVSEAEFRKALKKKALADRILEKARQNAGR